MSLIKIPLTEEDVPPGTVVRYEHAEAAWTAVIDVFPKGVHTSGSTYYFAHCMDTIRMNRSIPLTGKWDAAAWEPFYRHEQLDAEAKETFDQTQANAEGWGVFEVSGPASEIQRLDDGATDDGNGIPVFAGDKEAEAFVMGKAQQGSVYHQQALYLVGQHRDWGTPPVFSQDPRDQGTPEPPAGGWPG